MISVERISADAMDAVMGKDVDVVAREEWAR
jgi:hypothetical protein